MHKQLNINDVLDTPVKELPMYRGPLDQYLWYNNFVDDFLNFLKRAPNQNKIWICDDMAWEIIDPPITYDTYIFCSWIENTNIDLLKELNTTLADKNLILLSPQDFLNSELDNFKIFRLEHLHKLKRFYPKCTYKPLKNRQYSQSLLSRHPHVHKAIFLAEFIRANNNNNILYSFGDEKDVCITKDNFFELQKVYCDIDLEDEIIEIIKDLWRRSPIIIDNKKCFPVNNIAYTDTVMNWAVETWFISSTKSSPYLTEKTIKPIVAGCVFSTLGQKNTFNRIKRLGFSNYFDAQESQFDHLSDSERTQAMINFIKELAGKDLTYLQDQVDSNYNYFYGDFYDYIESCNAPIIDDLIEYIANI